MPESLIIVGASVRAAAQCAVRAGFAPLGVDLFGDVDLARIAIARRARPFPMAIPSAVAALPPAPLMYTGAMENHVDTVLQLLQDRTLLGNPSQVVTAVRNPVLTTNVFRSGGIPAPRVKTDPTGLATDGSWLRKPYRGCSGNGIRPWRGFPAAGEPEGYYQERLDGVSVSGVFVAAAGIAVLLGVTRQLTGLSWLTAAPLRYAGSVGPLPLDQAAANAWQRIGSLLAARFELSGLFGVDAVVCDDNIAPVEVNPRFTASIEILERVYGLPTVRHHVIACRDRQLPAWSPPVAERMAGKAILYANSDGNVPRQFLQFTDRCNSASDWPTIADIPQPGTRFRQGEPVTTVFATGPDEATVLDGLRERADRARRCLGQA